MALIKCTECGHEVSDKASTCPNCGCPIEKGLVCDECGVSISETDEMCPNCGNPINSKKGFNWKKPILSLVVSLFVLGAAYGIWQLVGNGGEQFEDIEITNKLIEAVHRYEYVSNFSEGFARVNNGNKYGFINSKGDEVIPCKYDYACDFSEGLALVSMNGKYGFVNRNGELVTPCKYDGAEDFSEGLALVRMNGKYGFVNKKGKLIIPCKYVKALSFSEGMSLVRNEQYKQGFINKKGEWIIHNKYDEVSTFSEGLARVRIGNKYGFINNHVELAIPCKYDYVDVFSEGLARVRIGNKYGFIDNKGELVIPHKYSEAEGFSEGLARVSNGDKYGFIDNKGELVIPFKYDVVYDFSEGLARVKMNDKYGYINKKGKLEIPCKFDGAFDFSEGLASVGYSTENEEIYGFLDKNGRSTFTKSDLNKIAENEKRIKEEQQRLEEERRLEEQGPSWIQGTWTYSSYGMIGKVVINNNNITYYIDGSVQYNGKFEYNNGALHFGGNYIIVDENAHRLKADNTHYMTRSGESGYTSNSSSSNNNDESKIMTRLRKLQEEGKELTNELAQMRAYGRMDPLRFMYIKQNLIECKDEQIRLARKLGDNQLVYQYQQQKNQLEQALRMIENGM